MTGPRFVSVLAWYTQSNVKTITCLKFSSVPRTRNDSVKQRRFEARRIKEIHSDVVITCARKSMQNANRQATPRHMGVVEKPISRTKLTFMACRRGTRKRDALARKRLIIAKQNLANFPALLFGKIF